MAPSAEHLIDQALLLPECDRAEMAHRLLASLQAPADDAESDEINATWEAELDSRITAYRSGKILAIDMHDALEMIRRGERPSL